MSLQISIKNSDGTQQATSITGLGKTALNTKDKYIDDYIIVDVEHNTEDATAAAGDIITGKTAYIADGTKVTGTIPIKTASDMTVLNNTVTAAAGYYPVATSKDVPVSTLDESIISGQAFEEATGDYAWKSTVNIPAGYHNSQTLEKTFSDVFPAPATEGTSADLRLGKQLYNHEGKLLTGTITEKSAATYTASTSDQTIAANQYLAGAQTIKAVSLNATASNMLSGTSVSIESNGSTVTSISGSIPTYNWNLYPGQFLCIPGYGASKCYTSNGTAWSEIINSSNSGCSALTFGNDRFVAVTSGAAYYCTDGVNWVAMTGLTNLSSCNDVVYGMNRFVTVGQNGKSYFSTDGMSWATMTGLSGSCQAVGYGDGKFITINSSGYVYYSTNGTSWSETGGSRLSTVDYTGIAYGNGKFICVGKGGHSSWSTDGITWTSMNITDEVDYYSIAFGNGKFVCVGQSGSSNYYESGYSWKHMTGLSGDDPTLKGVAFGNGRFVAVGYDGKSYYSTNGTSWSPLLGLPTSSNVFLDVAFSPTI